MWSTWGRHWKQIGNYNWCRECHSLDAAEQVKVSVCNSYFTGIALASSYFQSPIQGLEVITYEGPLQYGPVQVIWRTVLSYKILLGSLNPLWWELLRVSLMSEAGSMSTRKRASSGSAQAGEFPPQVCLLGLNSGKISSVTSELFRWAFLSFHWIWFLCLLVSLFFICLLKCLKLLCGQFFSDAVLFIFLPWVILSVFTLERWDINVTTKIKHDKSIFNDYTITWHCLPICGEIAIIYIEISLDNVSIRYRIS